MQIKKALFGISQGVFFCFWGSLISDGVFASSAYKHSRHTQPFKVKSTFRPYSTLTFAYNNIRTNQEQQLILTPPFNTYFTNGSSNKQSGSAGFAFGVEQEPFSLLFWQLGIAGYVNTPMKIEGNVWDFGLPDYNNFIYHYNIQNIRVVATGKVLSTIKNQVHPYLAGEIGTAFNRSFNYQELPLSFEQVPTIQFTNHNQLSTAWGLGTGIDLDLNDYVRVGAGYQFEDLGKTSLGISLNQSTNQTINFNHLYTHQFLLQLTALK